MTVNENVSPGERGPRVIGSIIAVPLFVAIFMAVSVAFHFFYTFMSGSVVSGVPRGVELGAAVISPVIGVYAARWVCDKALRAWSGWPLLVIFAVFTVANTFAVLAGYGDGVWYSLLSVIQLAAGTVAVWFIAVKKLY